MVHMRYVCVYGRVHLLDALRLDLLPAFRKYDVAQS